MQYKCFTWAALVACFARLSCYLCSMHGVPGLVVQGAFDLGGFLTLPAFSEMIIVDICAAFLSYFGTNIG